VDPKLPSLDEPVPEGPEEGPPVPEEVEHYEDITPIERPIRAPLKPGNGVKR
jgi:hypothetical protein